MFQNIKEKPKENKVKILLLHFLIKKEAKPKDHQFKIKHFMKNINMINRKIKIMTKNNNRIIK